MGAFAAAMAYMDKINGIDREAENERDRKDMEWYLEHYDPENYYGPTLVWPLCGPGDTMDEHEAKMAEFNAYLDHLHDLADGEY